MGEDDYNTKFWLIIFLIRRHQYILCVIKSQFLNVFGCLKYFTRFDGLCIYNESSSCYRIPVNIHAVDAIRNAYHKRTIESRNSLASEIETFSVLVETETQKIPMRIMLQLLPFSLLIYDRNRKRKFAYCSGFSNKLIIHSNLNLNKNFLSI